MNQFIIVVLWIGGLTGIILDNTNIVLFMMMVTYMPYKEDENNKLTMGA